jgi:hypothetical protein
MTTRGMSLWTAVCSVILATGLSAGGRDDSHRQNADLTDAKIIFVFAGRGAGRTQLEHDGIQPFERENQDQPERDADASHDRDDHRGGVDDGEPDDPVHDERVVARTETRRTQFEQDAFGCLAGNDRVENVAPGYCALRL